MKILLFQFSVIVRESDIKLINCMIKRPDCGSMSVVLKNCLLLLIIIKDVLFWEALIEISQGNVLRNSSYVPGFASNYVIWTSNLFYQLSFLSF